MPQKTTKQVLITLGIQLTPDINRKLNDLAERSKKSKSEVIRHSIDLFATYLDGTDDQMAQVGAAARYIYGKEK